MRYITLLLDSLEQVRVWARGKDGHIAAIMKSLLLVDGSILNIIGRISGIWSKCWVSSWLVIARAVAIYEGCVGDLSRVLLEAAQTQYRIASRRESIDCQRAVAIMGVS